MPRANPRRESPLSIRITPERRTLIDTQRQGAETDGAVAARLLDEYQLLLLDDEIGRTVRALRRLAARLEAGEITTT